MPSEGRIMIRKISLPVFSHKEEDTQSFRMITAQFCVNGHTQQAEIARAFGVTPNLVTSKSERSSADRAALMAPQKVSL